MPFNADESIVALMAKHILQGERPLFFYGQAYMGSLDAFLAAAGFAIFGTQVWVIRAVQILLFSATMIVWHRFCEEGFESRIVADAAVLLLAIPPVMVTLYTTISLGGYGEALLFGSLCMLLALQIVRGRSTVGRWLGLGLSAGIGFWAFPLSLVLSMPACLAALFIRPHPLPDLPQGSGAAKRIRTPVRLALLAAGALLGALPWIIGWIRLGAAALNELGGSAIAGAVSGGAPAVLVVRLLDFFVFGLSALLGFRPSWEFRALAPALIPFILALDLGMIGYSIWALRLRDGARTARLMLAGAALLLCAVYLTTPFGNDPSGRYFLPLALVAVAWTAVFAGKIAERVGRYGFAALLLLVLFCGWGTAESAVRNPPGITTQFDPVAQVDMRDLPAVIGFLRDHGETRGYTNYWVSFPLAFLSDEELIFTARMPYHPDLRYTARDDRYAPYDLEVEEAGRVAFITTNNPALDSLLESAFARLGVDYRVEQIGDFRIYYGLSRIVRPEEIFSTKSTKET